MTTGQQFNKARQSGGSAFDPVAPCALGQKFKNQKRYSIDSFSSPHYPLQGPLVCHIATGSQQQGEKHTNTHTAYAHT